MNVVTVIASPRKNGNCKALVDCITEGITEKHGSNKVYFVDDMNISPCRACKACKNLEKPVKCVLEDDFNRIMDEVAQADAFIFAAPNYFGEINAQGHIFMDRFYSMTKTTLNQLKNKPKCIVIHTYGASDGYYDEYINKRANRFRSIGCEVIEVLSVGKNRPTAGDCDELKEYARNLGRMLGE
ncbi:MAG: hypothetical protein BZ135_07355 [Methanosphaera sp. rholeuAM6]|nr:MAG: hypothetical protein BZ135_07355 [Methanosphaera sp. rholeuAM6]